MTGAGTGDQGGAVRDNRGDGRFELAAGGEIAFAAYRREGDVIVFTHTIVPNALEGQGIGSRLVSGALELVRERGERIVPLCSFVAHFVETHPEAQDLLA